MIEIDKRFVVFFPLQLQDMEAELKDKDAKFGAAQSRHKMSLRKLENANDDLRAMVAHLESENEKLKKQVRSRKNNLLHHHLLVVVTSR
jgi:peptidoglycan hydrolase CwlO-like protein